MQLLEYFLTGYGSASVSWFTLVSAGGVLYAFRKDKKTSIWAQYHDAATIGRKIRAGFLLYSVNNLLAADRAFNALRGGDPNETFSGAMGKAVLEGRCYFCKVFCDLLTLIDRRDDKRNHCIAAVDYDVGDGSRFDRRVHR